jgi:hypothetical protein
MTMREAPWERTADGRPARVVQPPRHPTLTPLRSRILAVAKMTDVSHVSAAFDGTPQVFEPWLTVLLDTGPKVEFAGVYRSAFPVDEPDGAAPSLAVRRAGWNAADDAERLRDEAGIAQYVTGPDHAASRIQFFTADALSTVTSLVEEVAQALHRGLPIDVRERSDPGLANIQVDLHDDDARFMVSYTPYRRASDTIESWLARWRRAMRALDEPPAAAAARRPDAGCRISYRASLPEMLQRYG